MKGTTTIGANIANMINGKALMLKTDNDIKPSTRVSNDCGDLNIVATAIFCSDFVALAFKRIGPAIFPAALISPRRLYALGIMTAGLIFIQRITGTKIRI